MKHVISGSTWLRTGALMALLVVFAAAPAFAGKATAPAAGYTYVSLGSPATPATAKPLVAEQSVVLVGGGYDVGEAFRWMITRAGVTPATPGHFLVLRAKGSDAYNPYIYSVAGEVDPTTPKLYEMVGGKSMGLLSAATLIIPSRSAAGDPAVAKHIDSASAIFIAGGDQADYYNFWRNTPVETALRSALARNIPIGGTSAGAEMLSEFAFVALSGSVTSSQALGDPFNKYMTIDPLNTQTYTDSFLAPAALASSIADVHVNTRDRLGRSIAFMARLGTACGGKRSDLGTRAIAINEETALLFAGTHSIAMAVNPYNAENFTSGLYAAANSAYFVRAASSPTVCKARTPLAYPSGNVVVTRWSAGPSPTPGTNTSYITGGSQSTAYYGVAKGVMTPLNNIAAPY